MYQRIPHLASRLPVALLCLACATLGRLAFTDPDVSLQEIAVTGIGLTGGTFDLVFDVYNPNDYRIRSTRLEVGPPGGGLRHHGPGAARHPARGQDRRAHRQGERAALEALEMRGC